ncbi:MAG TPA: hypothetical protein PL033_17840 [Candidatus Brocadiia bacterium]|nr:hypothetical protein [Candidatus Brocadiia bacterium]
MSTGTPQALAGAIERGRRMIADMRLMGAENEADSAATALDDIERESAGAQTSEKHRQLYIRARWAMRELAFSNPAINFNELLFVRRQWPQWNHQCSHRVGEGQIPGANLCVLKGLSPDGEVRDILRDGFAGGGVGRPDLSFDAKRIVFPWAEPRDKPTPYAIGQHGVRAGACLMYDIYEVGVDGTGITRLTDRPDAEDTEPAWLPDGRIAFTSSRNGRFVQCGDWALVCGIYSMAQDGSDVRLVTEPKEGEFYPSVMEDGRILYTRWDYMMKSYNVIQQLWAVNPDGANASLVYGDHYLFAKGPIAFQEARQIPGTTKIICAGAAHHNTGAGPIMIVDMALNRGNPAGMTNVTPEVGYPESGANNTHSKTGWYSSPYPLTANHFLCVYSFEEYNGEPRGYGIYLQDVHGNKELVYRASGASCYSPIPLRPRTPPRILPRFAESSVDGGEATLIVSDIYRGLDGVSRGEVKRIRVLETLSKCAHTWPQRCDLGVNCGWDVRAVLGTVPVEADGSAFFTVPAGRQLFFEALDEDYLEIRRMRNFMNCVPGEKVGCVGCHEPYRIAPDSGTALMATRRAPSRIEPPPWGTGGVGLGIVQPVLDGHCVRCHDGSVGNDKAFDLRGGEIVAAPAPMDHDEGPQHGVSQSFLNLLNHVEYIRVGGYGGEPAPLPANATGSRRSRLMSVLKKGHYDVRLEKAEWMALASWIDCNAPYYGGWGEIVLPPPKPLRAMTEADRERITARQAEIASECAPGRPVVYLDCGLQTDSGKEGPARIRQLQGETWQFDKDNKAPGFGAWHKDIAFDPTEVVFEISGLAERKGLRIGLTWWDFDNGGRRQSAHLSRTDGSGSQCVAEPAQLPAFIGRGEPPARLMFQIPEGTIRDGRLLLVIKRENAMNAVVGEIWVVEERNDK